ncbi:MAG: stage II sporulation protein R [Clostridia bacterium]|nr:stage II sporulation protein R [Clostridia bacterium]
MHRFFILLILAVFLTFSAAQGEEIPVRLHVIAESDDQNAQEMKMKIKDAVLEKAVDITKDAEDAQEAYARLFTSIGDIRACARETAQKCGFTGEIEALVTQESFPARLYGDLIVKEGEYPTLLIKIGKAEGKNWWCVIYPDLCLYGEKTNTSEIRFYSKFGYWFRFVMDRWSI